MSNIYTTIVQNLQDYITYKIMEQPLYYTPDVEELYVGYECEASFSSYGGYIIFDLNDSTKTVHHEPEDKEAAKRWSSFFLIEKESIFTANNARDHKTALEILKDKRLRTKYLDKEDIEKEGWTHTGGQLISTGRQDFESKFHLMRFFPSRVNNIGLSMITIMTKEDPMVMGSYQGYDKILYDGQCKSVNELRKIQKWLNIK